MNKEQNLLCPRCRSSDYSVLRYGSGYAGGCVVSDEKPKWRCDDCHLHFGALGLDDKELFDYYINEIRKRLEWVIEAANSEEKRARGFSVEGEFYSLHQLLMNPPVDTNHRAEEIFRDIIALKQTMAQRDIGTGI